MTNLTISQVYQYNQKSQKYSGFDLKNCKYEIQKGMFLGEEGICMLCTTTNVGIFFNLLLYC